MPRRKRSDGSARPQEIPTPMDQDLDLPADPRGPSTRTDPSMRDGDSGRGNPYESDADGWTTDNDVGDDREGGPPYSGRSGGAVGGTPAEGRATGGDEGDHIASPGSKRGDSTIGAP